MKWKTKPSPRLDDEQAILVKIRERALDLQAQLAGAWSPTEVTSCWVNAVIEQLADGRASLSMRKRLLKAFEANPTELVDALNTISDLVKKPSFFFTDDDIERTLFVYETNVGKKEYTVG